MQKKDDLIKENLLLKKKLEAAELWMQRQIHESLRSIQHERSIKDSRNRFENLLESDLVDMLSSRIESYFWNRLISAPRYTPERLMDSEIYWLTLQKHPTIDAFPVIASYQKILDAFFEEKITKSFAYTYRNNLTSSFIEKWIESDISNILAREYTLSLGRWYQFLSAIRKDDILGYYAMLLQKYLQQERGELYDILLSDAFFLPFEKLIFSEVFGKKRHEKKISYKDAENAREILTGWYESEGLMRILFAFLSR